MVTSELTDDTLFVDIGAARRCSRLVMYDESTCDRYNTVTVYRGITGLVELVQ